MMDILPRDRSQELLTRGLYEWQKKGENEWLARRSKARDYHAGLVDDYTKSYFDPEVHDKIVWTNQNIVKSVINEISTVYSEEATRNVKSNIYGDLTKSKNKEFLQAERLTNLLNVNLMHVAWRDDRLSHNVVDDFEIEMHPTIKNKIVAVSFPLGTPSSARGDNGDLWLQWTEDEIITFINGFVPKVVEREINPYGVVPFALIRTQEGRYSTLDIEPASDLVSVNEDINFRQAVADYNAKAQSFGIFWAKGNFSTEDGNSLPTRIGPDTLTVIPDATGTSEIGMLNPPDTITSLGDDSTRQYRTVAGAYGVSTALIEGTAQPESGVALRIKTQKLATMRKESMIMWREVEQAVYDIERQIVFTNLGVTLPSEFSIDYGKQEVIVSQEEVEAQNEYDLAHNMVTNAQILMRRDPVKYPTEEKAQVQIDKNAKVNSLDRGISKDAKPHEQHI